MSDGKPIVVITRPRSGSNLLLGYLSHFRTLVPVGEVFKPVRPARVSRSSAADFLDGAVLDDIDALQQRDLLTFWQNVSAVMAEHARRPVGKLFYGDIHAADPLWEAFRRATVVHLIRENPLASFVSNLLALRAGAFRQKNGSCLTYDDEPIIVPADEADRHLKNLERQILAVRDRYRDHIAYEEVSYDVVADEPQIASLLKRLVDEPPKRPLRPKIKRQRTRPLSEVVSNYAEVRDFDRNFALIDPHFRQ